MQSKIFSSHQKSKDMISAEVIQLNSAINFKCQMVATPLQNIMPCFVASNPIDGGWSLAAATAGMVARVASV